MTERLTDEALDIINFGAEVWTGKWKERAVAWIEAYHSTPADDLRAALQLPRYSPASTGNNSAHMVEDEAGQFIARKDIRAALSQKKMQHEEKILGLCKETFYKSLSCSP